jgi:hypothetical protein
MLKKNQSKNTAHSIMARECEDDDGFSGGTSTPVKLMRARVDELDQLTARDMASIRYKRNHEYMSDILSPSTARPSLNTCVIDACRRRCGEL